MFLGIGLLWKTILPPHTIGRSAGQGWELYPQVFGTSGDHSVVYKSRRSDMDIINPLPEFLNPEFLPESFHNYICMPSRNIINKTLLLENILMVWNLRVPLILLQFLNFRIGWSDNYLALLWLVCRPLTTRRCLSKNIGNQ